MSSFILGVILSGSIAGLTAVLVLSQRQFEPGDGDERRPGTASGPPPVPPPEYASAGLSGLVASTIESATRAKPRNRAESDAVGALRVALDRAVEGEFGSEVREAIERLGGVASLHDVRPTSPTDDPLDQLIRGPEIDHLAVSSRGVTVVATRARAEGIDRQSALSDAVTDRSRGVMVEEILRQMAAVRVLVDPVPVHGLVVLRDVLALPDEIRSTVVDVRGVHLATADQLAAVLTEPGPVVDTAVVIARLRDGLEPALPPADDELRLSGQR